MFNLDQKQKEKLALWLEEQEKVAIEKQKSEIMLDDPWYATFASCWENGHAYSGAIGSTESYMFTPTSIGTIVKVKHSITENTIDLSDYEDW